ncbi:valacyclovir hydrolase [Copidosoma floridanum]|uniref:valacyclovir hydrolase n=1 Tax=Copidosoma floridanum TaxID=29053 RepID=UPI0006C9661E|nr:valacyclovir hydrolase [Copidosoma floridanum]
MSSATSTVTERKVLVDGVDINYAKTGTGEHLVLLLPGAVGTIWTDFKPQIEKLSKEKFTIIAWDPPGYGKSRPPNRTFPEDFFRKDAALACNLMKTLGYEKFSLVGYSDGGITALIMAAQYPENVQKIVVFGANTYIAPLEAEIYKKLRDISSWSEGMRALMIEIYGEEYFTKTWSDWVDGMLRIYEKNNGDICKADLTEIKCPTLIIHGRKDEEVLMEHADYMKSKIKNSRLEIFEAGEHDLHLKHPDETNALLEKFLTEDV